MGGIKRNSSNTTYVNIVEGNWVRRYKEHQHDANGSLITREREIKDDKGVVTKTVIEEQFDSWVGLIVKAEIVESDFGPKVVLHFEDEQGSSQLQFGLYSRYASSFLKIMPNINTDEEVELKPYNFVGDDGKKAVGMNLFQNGEKLPYKWTKEKPGKLPQWENSMDPLGKPKWNNDKEMAFLVDIFRRWAGTLGELNIAKKPDDRVKSEPIKPKSEPIIEEDDDDLPF